MDNKGFVKAFVFKKNQMKKILLFVVVFSWINGYSQSRISKLSANTLTNFYGYGVEDGPYNSAIRLGEGLALVFTSYDTIKKSGTSYELSTVTTSGFYKYILSGNNILEVSDIHANASIIFPIFMVYNKRMEQSLGFGIGVSTLLGRDYSDDQGTYLGFNTTTLKELKPFKYWSGTFFFDYEIGIRFSKRIGINLGIRFFSNSPVHSPNSSYKITQGNGLAIKTGFFFKLK